MDTTLHRAAVGAAGVTVIAAWSVVMVLQVLLWNPLAAAPGLDYDEIVATMAAQRESLGQARVIAVAAIGVLLALAVALLGVLRVITPSATVLLHLVLLALAPIAYVFASFGAGMSLADTFGISGGDKTPWGGVLMTVGFLAVPVLLSVAIVQGRRAEEEAAARRQEPTGGPATSD